MTKDQPIVNLVLRAVALGMGVVTIVLSVLGTATGGSINLLLGIGLFAISLDALNRSGG